VAVNRLKLQNKCKYSNLSVRDPSREEKDDKG